MLRLISSKTLLVVLVLVAAATLTAGIALTCNAAGVVWSPTLVASCGLALFGALGWGLAFRVRARARQTALKLSAAHEAAVTASWRDPVSGLASYKLFDAALHNAYERAQRYARPFSIMLIEVSSADPGRGGMRTPAQERVLRYLGGIVQRNLRAADVPARLSESKFGVVLAETDQDGARTAWERLRAIALAEWPEERSWSISGGVAGYNVDIASVDSLLAEADRRLALEKRRLRAEPEP
ncbi:MAG TPA: diguanylate cyclase [Dehalococcoidia bacterium]|jgi:diguanylate cyclase (GGDEF)-like protein|nr:diguanylate cyclase [Dehalococcoidia bacterium]